MRHKLAFLALAGFLSFNAAHAARTLTWDETQRLIARFHSTRDHGDRGHFVMDRTYSFKPNDNRASWQVQEHTELWVDGPALHLIQQMVDDKGVPTRDEIYMDPYGVYGIPSRLRNGQWVQTPIIVASARTGVYEGTTLPNMPVGSTSVLGVSNDGGTPNYSAAPQLREPAVFTPFSDNNSLEQPLSAVDLGDSIDLLEKLRNSRIHMVLRKRDLALVSSEVLPAPYTGANRTVTSYSDWKSVPGATYATRSVRTDPNGLVTTTSFETVSLTSPPAAFLHPDFNSLTFQVKDARVGWLVSWGPGELKKVSRGRALDGKTLLDLSRKRLLSRQQVSAKAVAGPSTFGRSPGLKDSGMPWLRVLLAAAVIAALLVVGLISAFKTLRGSPRAP